MLRLNSDLSHLDKIHEVESVKTESEKTSGPAWADVFLTPLKNSDTSALYEWQNSASIRDLTMGFRFPVQTSTVENWIKKVEDQNSKSLVVYGIRVNTLLVGIVSLHNINQYQRKSLLGIYIGNNEQQKKGVGFIATSLILDFAFNGLDFRKVGLEVVERNQNAISLYERVGFVKEGTKREEYFIDGKCLDTHFYGILKQDFQIGIPHDANRLLHTL